MKTFDWGHAATIHQLEWLDWLKANHNKPITVEEYVAAYRSRRATDPRPYNAKRYYHKTIIKQYENLKAKFGFFL
jgi:hypothetical protein